MSNSKNNVKDRKLRFTLTEEEKIRFDVTPKEKTPIELLYEEILEMKHIHEKSFYELEFVIDNCLCYYFFMIHKQEFHQEELNRKYHRIYVGIKIKNIYLKDCSTEDICVEIRDCKISDGIEGFKKLMDEMNSLRKNHKIVVSSNHSIDLVPIEIYNKHMKYSNVFEIELETCYICLNPVMPFENLECGHKIHINCAYEMYKKNDNKYKCGICRKETAKLLLKKCVCED